MKTIAKTHQSLPKTNLPDRSLIDHVRNIAEPENFLVGLADSCLPQPRNILFFCRNNLDARPKDTSHHRYMLILNLEAENLLLLDGLLLRLMPGQALLVFPFQAHRYLLQEQRKRITWLFITFELPETDALHALRNRTINITPDLWPFIDTLLVEYRRVREQEGRADEVSALLSYLLLRLLRLSHQLATTDWAPRLPLPAHRIVQRASHYIATHMAEPLSVNQIAATLSISTGYLRTCYRRVLGMRVAEFIRRSRVYAACALLSRSESNITEIASHCGLGSVYTFSRAFKREIGMAPTRYRTHLWEQHNIGSRTRKKRL